MITYSKNFITLIDWLAWHLYCVAGTPSKAYHHLINGIVVGWLTC